MSLPSGRVAVIVLRKRRGRPAWCKVVTDVVVKQHRLKWGLFRPSSAHPDFSANLPLTGRTINLPAASDRQSLLALNGRLPRCSDSVCYQGLCRVALSAVPGAVHPRTKELTDVASRFMSSRP